MMIFILLFLTSTGLKSLMFSVVGGFDETNRVQIVSLMADGDGGRMAWILGTFSGVETTFPLMCLADLKTGFSIVLGSSASAENRQRMLLVLTLHTRAFSKIDMSLNASSTSAGSLSWA